MTSPPRCRRRWGSVVWCLGMALLAGCGGSPGPSRAGEPGLEARLRISPTPPMTGPAQVRVEVLDQGVPAPDATEVDVRVDPEIQEGGEESHESTGPALRLRPTGDGVWTGTLDFPRAGPAVVRIDLRRPDGARAVQRIPLTVARRPPEAPSARP